jgi:hypothetical protein
MEHYYVKFCALFLPVEGFKLKKGLTSKDNYG